MKTLYCKLESFIFGMSVFLCMVCTRVFSSCGGKKGAKKTNAAATSTALGWCSAWAPGRDALCRLDPRLPRSLARARVRPRPYNLVDAEAHHDVLIPD